LEKKWPCWANNGSRLTAKNGCQRKNEEEAERGRQRLRVLDWMMVDGYGELKEEARQ